MLSSKLCVTDIIVFQKGIPDLSLDFFYPLVMIMTSISMKIVFVILV